jgi:uroporphyrinogen-III synthase
MVQAQVTAGARVLWVKGRDVAHVATPPAGESANTPPVANPAATGSAWLAQILRGQGAVVQELAVYERRMPAFDAAQRRWALDAAGVLRTGMAVQTPVNAVWLFSSSEGVRNLAAWLPGQDWRLANCLATHPRIAEAAAQIGFGQVRVCMPLLPDVIAAIHGLGTHDL